LHWLLTASLLVAIITGLRIATETPERGWINIFHLVLPASWVWTGHIKAAVLLIAISFAYPIYVARAGLARRVRLDKVRIRGLIGRRTARWGAINIAFYWAFYAALLAQLVTGCMLYFGQSVAAASRIHWYGMWFIAGYAVLHVLCHWMLGGAPQLLRVFRPARLMPPPPPFDPADLLALLDRQGKLQPASVQPTETPASKMDAASLPSDPSDVIVPGPAADAVVRRPQPGAKPEARRHPPGHRSKPHGWQQRRPMIQANPLMVACAAAIVGVTFLLTMEHQTADTLHIRRIDPNDVPVIDGDAADPIWRSAPATYMITGHGGNFDDKGETSVSIQAVHDGVWAYFLFIWDDPTRSLKQLPLRKTADGWQLLHDGYENGDEHAYNEDKFSVLLTKLDVILAGDRTFHAGPEPADGKPRTLSGRGLHYTMQDGLFVDVWQWKATSTNPSLYMDDDHFGPPAEGTDAQIKGDEPYRGGFAPDPGTSNYQDNFTSASGRQITPRRLPKDLAAVTAALGRIDLDPEHGDSEGAHWYMTEDESVPYSRELDLRIPEGTVIPGVIISGEYSGDRADVRCAGRWASGRWALEVVRRLESSSPYDVPISSGTFMRVAAFDHAQIRHTRHVRPIRLEVE
jgi:hypothetical protein